MSDIKTAKVTIVVTLPYSGDFEEAESIIRGRAKEIEHDAAFIASWYDVDESALRSDHIAEVQTTVAFE